MEEALRLDPECDSPYCVRGLIRRAKADLAGAISDFNTALRLAPDDGEVYYYRGQARADQGDFEGALSDFRKALELESNQEDAIEIRAKIEEWSQRGTTN